ncbi:MAG: DUF4055 domain-containing protein [Psychrobium sp.]
MSNEFSSAQADLKLVRDCVEGSHKIKSAGLKYLSHPSMVDTTSAAQVARYKAYKDGAEFDNYPDLTRRGWLGKMRLANAEVGLPSKLEYLLSNADGDGVSLTGVMESTASNVFQTKWHILVADYQGLSDVNIETLSMADAQELNPRATIKQYRRESVEFAHFRRINGVMQLSYICFVEHGMTFDAETGDSEEVESKLILALDDNGNYYQQKIVDDEKGEMNYITVGGKPMKLLPVEIVSDEENPVGMMPQGMGMLYPVCDAALSRYRVSADYKETMRRIAPTPTTEGWRQGDFAVYKEVNNGSDYIELGGTSLVNLPNNVKMNVLNPSVSLAGFEKYFETNTQKVRAMGGTFKDGQGGTMTATEADINATEQNAMLETVASSIENSIATMLEYCAMFEGLKNPEIKFSLPRDFATPKLSVEEAKVQVELIGLGVRTPEQVVKILAQGGWDIQDAEQTIKELLEYAPVPPQVAPIGDNG